MIHFASYSADRPDPRHPAPLHRRRHQRAGRQERSYDLVVCLDVLFHYPYEEVCEMLENLTKLAAQKLVISFALRTPMNDFWMKMGRPLPCQEPHDQAAHVHLPRGRASLLPRKASR